MGIIAAMFGVPLTAILLGVTYLIYRYALKKHFNIDNRFYQFIILLLLSLPLNTVVGMYAGGVLTIGHEFAKHELLAKRSLDEADMVGIPIVSLMAGTLNFIEPGKIVPGDKGPCISTVPATIYSFVFFLVINGLYLFYKVRKNDTRIHAKNVQGREKKVVEPPDIDIPPPDLS